MSGHGRGRIIGHAVMLKYSKIFLDIRDKEGESSDTLLHITLYHPHFLLSCYKPQHNNILRH